MKRSAFTIAIKARAKQRARSTTRGGRTRHYTPTDTVVFESMVRSYYKGSGGQFMSGAIRAQVHVARAIPKRFTREQRRQIEQGTLMPTTKPDVDNYAKAVMDALRGVAYKDDAQIVDLHSTKSFADGSPFVHVVISEVGAQ
jgi:Holliday junction resolvase RusA-like endonuclease